MKISRPVIVLALSLLAGLLATVLAARWLQAQAGQTTPVVVATGDIPLGTPLEAGMLTTVSWPPGRIPDGAAQDPGALIGRVTRTTLTRHEPVLEQKMAAPGSRGGLSAVIAPGKRALTVKVNEVMGVAGFALPGSLVDVMVNANTEDSHRSSGSSMSRIVLERILVLAVAQESSRDATAPRVANAVTLEVTPEQAERLDLARSVGSLSLVLRNPVDTADAQTNGAIKGDLLGSRSASSSTGAATPPVPPSTKRHLAAVGGSVNGAGTAAHPAHAARRAATNTDPIAGVDADAADPPRAEVIRGTWRTTATW